MDENARLTEKVWLRVTKDEKEKLTKIAWQTTRTEQLVLRDLINRLAVEDGKLILTNVKESKSG